MSSKLLIRVLCILIAVPLYAFSNMPEIVSSHAKDSFSINLKWRHQFQSAGFYAAEKKGFYRDAGLVVKIVEGSPAMTAVQAVLTGRAEFGVSGADVLYYYLRGEPLVCLAALFQHSPYAMISLKKSNIRYPSDFIGKKVMTSNGRASIQFPSMFLNEGIPQDKVTYVNHSWNIDDLINGKVDAMSVYLTDEPFRMKQRGIAFDIIDIQEYGIDFYGDILFCSRQTLKDNPSRVKAFRAASLRGWHYAMEHIEEMIPYILDLPGVREHGTTAEALRFEAGEMHKLIIPQIIEIGHVNPDRMQHIAQAYLRLDSTTRDRPLDTFLYDPDPVKDNRLIFGILFAVLIMGAIISVLLWLINRTLKKEIARKTLALKTEIEQKQKLLETTHKIQKLESLGVLAGGIAHDFNNLLSGIYGYIDLARSTTQPATAKRYLDATIKTMGRARALTQQLLTFAKGGAPVRSTEPLLPFIQEAAQFALCGSNVSCTIDIPADLWCCNFDKNQINQVIDNLVINAQQAMPGGGDIKLGARNIHFSDNQHPSLPAGDYVQITITDTGIGIPGDIINKIFDPFFTTKAKGHGLGLSTCYSIVSKHGGALEVKSEPGRGSTFTVYLPALPGCTLAIAHAQVTAHRGSGTIIVMDDEPVIQETFKDMLEGLGYTVLCARNGQEALDFLKAETARHQPVRAIILDLTIPGGIGGRETLSQLRKTNSDIPVFVASGYADDPVIANPTAFGFTASICKPFRMTDLAQTLEKHLPTGQQSCQRH